jgi:hypothetical protein
VDYDEAETTEILNKYRAVICDNTERFEFVTKVMSAYSEFETKLNSKIRTERFVTERWRDFQGDFSLPDTDASIIEKVVKISVHNVIKSRFLIDAVKKGVHL